MTTVAANEHLSLREAMRWLLLPIRPELEDDAIAAARGVLEDRGVQQEDEVTLVELTLTDWREHGTLDEHLQSVVGAYLRAGNDVFGNELAAHYFDLHQRIEREPLFDHRAATAFLSHAHLIGVLVTEEGLSAAQIANLIAARDKRLEVTWPLVEQVLAALDLKPTVTQAQVSSLFKLDSMAEVETFADADQDTCIEMVAAAGERLGVGYELRIPLSTLLPFEAAPFGPYLQMLHYQCVVAEYFDHDLHYIYEFNPRGEAAAWLFQQYPPSLAGSGNPFLNNAKSVDSLGRSWATSKKPAQRGQAHALVTVVQALSAMGYAARREMASWIRWLLRRRMRLAEGSSVEVPSLGEDAIAAILDAVRSGPTHTQGIIEQRVVDAVTVTRYQAPTWVARGVGDSVNATNVSRRKCGDCDFQDSDSCTVAAFEAHAGKLTGTYVEGHKRTLAAVLGLRVQEWEENFGEGVQWTADVTFVAHEATTGTELARVSSADAEATITATTFEEFLEDVEPDDPLVRESFEELVRNPMNEARTPESAREALLAILS